MSLFKWTLTAHEPHNTTRGAGCVVFKGNSSAWLFSLRIENYYGWKGPSKSCNPNSLCCGRRNGGSRPRRLGVGAAGGLWTTPPPARKPTRGALITALWALQTRDMKVNERRGLASCGRPCLSAGRVNLRGGLSSEEPTRLKSSHTAGEGFR